MNPNKIKPWARDLPEPCEAKAPNFVQFYFTVRLKTSVFGDQERQEGRAIGLNRLIRKMRACID